jgi:hypothetical protein
MFVVVFDTTLIPDNYPGEAPMILEDILRSVCLSALVVGVLAGIGVFE